MIWLSIDPGANGAIAEWDAGSLMGVRTIPVLVAKRSGKSHTLVHVGELVAAYKGARIDEVWIENVGPTTSASGSFYFGRGVGVLEGFFSTFCAVNRVAPAVWQKGVGIATANKGASRALAAKLYPAFADSFARVKDDGLAESVLIGHHVYWNPS